MGEKDSSGARVVMAIGVEIVDLPSSSYIRDGTFVEHNWALNTAVS